MEVGGRAQAGCGLSQISCPHPELEQLQVGFGQPQIGADQIGARRGEAFALEQRRGDDSVADVEQAVQVPHFIRHCCRLHEQVGAFLERGGTLWPKGVVVVGEVQEDLRLLGQRLDGHKTAPSTMTI